jgi:nucleotidyltransferase/DNA polymerase involved in DNA repair
MATPVRDAKRLTRLLCDKIETIEPGFGIEVMTLAASVAEPLERKQTISSLVEESAADVSDLIDTLMNRVGERALYRLAPVASDVPERSVCRIPAMRNSSRRRPMAGSSGSAKASLRISPPIWPRSWATPGISARSMSCSTGTRRKTRCLRPLWKAARPIRARGRREESERKDGTS